MGKDAIFDLNDIHQDRIKENYYTKYANKIKFEFHLKEQENNGDNNEKQLNNEENENNNKLDFDKMEEHMLDSHNEIIFEIDIINNKHFNIEVNFPK